MIFVVGNSRSGTTMLGRMLGLSSAVHTFDELHFFEQQISADELMRNPVWRTDRLVQLAQVLIKTSRDGLFAITDPSGYRAEAEAIVANLSQQRPVDLYRAILHAHALEAGKRIPLEQTPRYLFLAREILEQFPKSHMINMVRDPRDVMLSQKNRWRVEALAQKNVSRIWMLRSWSNYHPYVTSKLWSGAVRMSEVMVEHPRFHSISFETLVRDPEAELRQLCTAIELPFEESMLQVSQIGSSLKSDAPARLGPDESRIGSWKKGGISKAEIQICEEIAGQQMQTLGYEPSGDWAHPVRVALLKATFPLKLGIAGLLNLNRVSSLPQMIARRLG